METIGLPQIRRLHEQSFDIKEKKIRELHVINDGKFIKKLVVLLFFLILGSLFIYDKSNILKVVGIILIGTMYAHAVELQHQCLHHIAFKNRKANKIAGVILGLPMLVSFTHYRVTHLYHHRNLGTSDDKEFFKYNNEKISAGRIMTNIFSIARYFTVFKNIWLNLNNRFHEKNANKNDLIEIKNEYFIMILLMVSFLISCIFLKSFAIIKLWIIPILTISEPIHFLIEFPEHHECNKNTQNIYKNTRTLRGSWFSAWITNGNNFHVEHHLMPSVPNDKLIILHKIIAHNIIHFNKSYTDFFFSNILRKRIELRSKIFSLMLMGLLILIPIPVRANLNIKVAVLDNLMSQKLASAQYVVDYMQGLDLAVSVAKSSGIDVEYKTFFYDRKPLSILEQIEKIKDYNPDFIIGPHTSDKFLLLKDYFKDILVISPLASSSDIKKMPNNFFTLVPTDDVTGKAMAYFVKNQLKATKAFNIIESDCNSCEMVSAHFQDEFLKMDSRNIVKQIKFVSSESETIDIRKLIKDFNPGDVIVMPDTSYSSGILISRITNYLKSLSLLPIFVGADGWGDWSVSYVGKTPVNYRYDAYRISPNFKTASASYVRYSKEYIKKFKSTPPSDRLTYYVFHLIMSVINSAEEVKKLDKINRQKSFILSFQAYMHDNIKKYSNFTYDVYQLNNHGEKVLDNIVINFK